MAVNLSPIWGAGAQLLDNSGNVLSGGKIYTYLAGTTTPAVTYTSSNGNTANSNPIILNSAGRVPYEIWLTDSIEYKFVLKDSNDVLIGTWDNLVGINSNFINYYGQQEIQTATAGQTVFTLVDFEYQPGTGNLSVFVDGVNQYGPGAQYAYVETDANTVTFVSGLHVGASVKFTTTKLENPGVADASQISYTPDANSLFTTATTNVENVLNLISNETNGSDYVGFNQDLTDSVDRTVSEKLKDYVSVKDFGAVGDGSTDDTTAIQNAINSIATSGTIFFPVGSYKISSTLSLPQSKFISFQGFGVRDTKIISYAGGVPVFNYARAASVAGSIFEFKNLQIQLDGLAKTTDSAAIKSFGYSDGQDDNWLRVYNCYFYGFNRAIYAKWTGQSKIHDCWFQSNTVSIVLLRGASFWHLFDCTSFDDTFVYATDPIADAYSNGLNIDSCDNVTAAGTNVFIEGWQAVYMWGCGWDLGTAGTAAVWLKTTYDVTIRDCYVSSNPSATRNGIYLDDSSTVVIHACQIVNNVIGINVVGDASTATKIVIDSCKFDGQDTNDIVFLDYTTSSKIINNHFQKQMSRTGTNYEIYASSTGTDYDIITQNTFHGTTYVINAGANSIVTNNIFGTPGTV